MRTWYKKVRQEYGVGFGQKVALGEAILDFPAGLARSVRSLSEQGVQRQLGSLLDNLANLKEIFAPVSKLQNDTMLLAGEDGAIAPLLKSLHEALHACGPLTTDNATSMAELASRIEVLDSLKKRP